jgi:predicted SnoaL-like aldol condensation-catalyzing enzyme
MEKLQINKQMVIAFYEMMFNRNEVREAVNRYISDDFREHSPYMADGKEALIEYFERMAIEYPGKQVTIKRSLAEGDYVVLHCHQQWPDSEEEHLAGIDIFRIDGEGKIAEHWDVLQAIPEEKINPNPVF